MHKNVILIVVTVPILAFLFDAFRRVPDFDSTKLVHKTQVFGSYVHQILVAPFDPIVVVACEQCATFRTSRSLPKPRFELFLALLKPCVKSLR
jgi:hypothetical protein